MTKEPKCSAYDLRALEAWLAKLASDGLVLTDVWKEFHEGAKRERRFYIEPAEKRAEPSQALRDSRALLGWEYVCAMDKQAFYVWRSAGETATLPRARELAGSWADRRLGQKLLWWWIALLAIPATLAAYLTYCVYDAKLMEMPLWKLLTNWSLQWAIISMLLTMFCGFWATRREYRDLRRLRRAVREGEYQEPVAQHTAWYEAMRTLPTVVAIAVLLTTCSALHNGKSHVTQEELAGYPMLYAETFGGADGDYWVDRYDTALCGTIVLHEGDWVDVIDKWRWMIYATQLEVYKPRIAILAEPLAAELRDYYSIEQGNALDGVDGAYYGRTDSAQYLLLCDDGVVLLYRTDAPDDLRVHLDQFAALLESYR